MGQIQIRLLADEDCFSSSSLDLHEGRASSRCENIVYQWIDYPTFEITDALDDGDTVYDLELSVNSSPIRVENWILEGRCLRVSLQKDCAIGTKPFANLFGLCVLSLRLKIRHIGQDDRELCLYTDHLAVAVDKEQDDSVSESLSEMLEYIYAKNRTMLLGYAYGVESDIFDKLIDECVERLKQALPFFINSSCSAFQRNVRIEPIEKIKKIDGHTLASIADHPEYLYESGEKKGIVEVGKRQMLSKKAMSGFASLSFNTYENRMILSFVRSLLLAVQKRNKELLDLFDAGTLDCGAASLQDGYVLSSALLKKYGQTVIEERLNKNGELEQILKNLYSRYQSVLSCKLEPSFNLRPTAVFMEKPHYRLLFEVMKKWFRPNEADRYVKHTSSFVEFPSADVVYEFYCLSTLRELIAKAGFSEKKNSRFEYDYSFESFYAYNGDNTFDFCNSKTGCRLILYYQPLIYARNGKSEADADCTNDIALFRTDTDNPKRFYSPDFLLKRIDGNGRAVYGIIDAKWRYTELVMRESMPDTVNKYLHSILDKNTFRPVPFMWLLQGKDDDKLARDTAFVERCYSSISYPRYLRDSSGIVRLTPKSGSAGLKNILGTFLNPTLFPG